MRKGDTVPWIEGPFTQLASSHSRSWGERERERDMRKEGAFEGGFASIQYQSVGW